MKVCRKLGNIKLENRPYTEVSDYHNLRNLRAPRTSRLPKTKPKNITPKPANSRYEWGSLGGQVTGNGCSASSARVGRLWL